uniref:nucleotidyltransferase domain-containing protein n=1 Tax=Alistipes sp. TaxID=1872444 RepID=UPI004056CEDF
MDLNNDIHLLLYLTGCGLRFREINPDLIADIPEVRWKHIYSLAHEQGVLAIVFDAIEKLPTVSISRALKLQWIAAVHTRELNYKKQYNTAVELATAFENEGIKTTVLKGLAISTYYPNPSYREFGDFDCFLGNDYESGNCIAEKLGATVERDYYRHSHIFYKSQMVENHQFCVGVRGSRKMKGFEKHLYQVMHCRAEYIDENNALIRPSCDFNALFLTSHAMTHFLVEGIKLRHICDWAVLLRHEQNNIDWQSFYHWTDKLNYTRFANTLTYIATKYLELGIENVQIKQEDKYCVPILEDIFQSNSVFNKGYGVWRSRLVSIKNRLSSLWKFHKIYQQSAIKTIMIQVLGFLFDRKPKI